MSMASGPPKRVICTARMSRRLGVAQACTDVGLRAPTEGVPRRSWRPGPHLTLASRRLGPVKLEGRLRAAGYADSARTARSTVDVRSEGDASGFALRRRECREGPGGLDHTSLLRPAASGR